MSQDLLVVIILYVANFAAALVIFLMSLKKEHRVNGWLRFLFMLLVPIVGLLFFLMAKLAYAVYFIIHKGENLEIDLSDLSFSQERTRILMDADVEKEMDTVPLEEALLVSERKERRKSFIDLLKDDNYEETLSQIRGAVENTDTEIAHYAASFVADLQTKYKQEESDLRQKLIDEPSEKNLIAYVEAMERILEKNIFSVAEFRVYLKRFNSSATQLYEESPEKLKDHTIQVLVNLWKNLKQVDEIEPWIERASLRARRSLEAFKLCASYYYSIGDRDQFMRLIENVRYYSVDLDSEALNWIRFFQS